MTRREVGFALARVEVRREAAVVVAAILEGPGCAFVAVDPDPEATVVVGTFEATPPSPPPNRLNLAARSAAIF